MTWTLNIFILGCFGIIAAALAFLLGLHHPTHLSIASGLGIALPLSAVLGHSALTIKDPR